MKRLVLSIVLAAVLWSVMFSPLTAPHVDFWLMMSLSALTLSVLSLRFDAGWRREADSSWTNLLLGIVIAVALWGIFWTGDKVSTWLFDFARPQVNLIYGMKLVIIILFTILTLILTKRVLQMQPELSMLIVVR